MDGSRTRGILKYPIYDYHKRWYYSGADGRKGHFPKILKKPVRFRQVGSLTYRTREMGSCGTFSEEAVKGRCEMNKVLKTMVAVAALTLTANAENVTANETALWNEVKRVFLTWNGKEADRYAKKEVVMFTDEIGSCQAFWGGEKGTETGFSLFYEIGEKATCDDYKAVYQTIVETLNAYGKVTEAKELRPSMTYEWTLADGRTIKVGPTMTKVKDMNEIVAYGMYVIIRIPQK